MSNIFDLAKTIQPSITASVKSNITKKSARGADPLQKARDVFLTRIQENIDGLAALNDGKEWPKRPPKKEGGREIKYAKWFEFDVNTNAYELQALYNSRPIKGVLGYEENGDAKEQLEGVTKETLPVLLEAIKEKALAGEYNDYLLAAKQSIADTMRKNKQKKLEAVA